MEGLPVFKNFVKKHREISVRWKSDDPCFVRADQDMYDVQREGVLAGMGKKDKATGNQCYFVCHVCDDIEVSSIKTLEVHCEGVQHRRKSMEFQEKFETKRRITPIVGNIEDKVPAWKRGQLGFGFLIEYRSRQSDKLPIYFCTIRDCESFRGNVEDTLQHLNSKDHLEAVKKLNERPTDQDPTELRKICTSKDYRKALDNEVPDSFFREQAMVQKAFIKRENDWKIESNSDSSTRSRSSSPIRCANPLPPVEQKPRELPPPVRVYRSDPRSEAQSCRQSSSPSFSTPPSTSPSFADDMAPIKEFDRMLENYARKCLLPLIIASGRGDIDDYIRKIKIEEKRKHLRKGVTMDTIKFTEETKKAIDAVADVARKGLY